MNQVLAARESFAKSLSDEIWVLGEQTRELSSSGLYALEVSEYNWSEPGRSSTFSAVTILDAASERKLLEFNAEDRFLHGWIQQGDHEYLLCGELQGSQTVVELPSAQLETYFVSADDFIWVEFYPSPDSKKLVISGCHWAWPFEFIAYDFSSAMNLPLPMIGRTTEQDNGENFGIWLDNDSFSLVSTDGSVRIIQAEKESD
jgi:hypothetical protein